MRYRAPDTTKTRGQRRLTPCEHRHAFSSHCFNESRHFDHFRSSEWRKFRQIDTSLQRLENNPTWWRLALLAFCAGNSPATGEFPSQRPVTRRFDVFFDHARFSKQPRRRRFETTSRPLWRHCNENVCMRFTICCVWPWFDGGRRFCRATPLAARRSRHCPRWWRHMGTLSALLALCEGNPNNKHY